MYTQSIKLDTPEKAKSLCQLVKQIDSDATLESGRYVINAKSILGIFSLSLKNPVLLKIEDATQVNDSIKKALEEYAAA